MSEHNQSPEMRYSWAVETARKNGLRKTGALERILKFLSHAHKPVTWTELCEAGEISGHCDPATVFRILSKAEKIGVIRRLGFHERSSYFSLAVPGEHHDYIICKECGNISELDIHCPVHSIEKQVMEKSGFKELYHELEFYGVCPQCQHGLD